MSRPAGARRRRRLARAAVAALVLALPACGTGEPDDVPVVGISGPALLAVQPGDPVRLTGFGAHPDGTPVALAWDLGDGATASGVGTVEHSYPEPGTYLVTLTDAGTDTATPAQVVVQVGSTPAGTDDFALRFGGTGRDDVDRVKIQIDDPNRMRAYGADIGATDTTIELWLRTRPGENPAGPAACGEADAWIHGNVVLDRDRFDQGRKFGLSIASGTVVFGLTGDDGTAVSMCGTGRIDDDRWHHVAVTRSVRDGTLRLFVDGVAEAEAAGPPGDVSYPDGARPRSKCHHGRPCTRSDPYLVIGAEKHDAGPEFPSYRGLVDELRLSTVIRYPGPFDPAGRFEPDPQTAALYHFDEGTGSVARDAGGDRTAGVGILHVGGPAPGPAWVPSSRAAGP
jgi:PKD repeat protein